MPIRPRRLLKRLVTPPLMVAAVLLVLLEDVLWRELARLMARIGLVPLVRRAEDRIRTLPPMWAAAVFVLPAAILLPFKLAAVWAIGTGRIGLGLLVLAAAKVTGTALLARLYVLCEPSLMTVAWFVNLHGLAMRVKAWAHRHLDSWPAWRLARRLVGRARTRLRDAGTVVRRWRSIRRRTSPSPSRERG